MRVWLVAVLLVGCAAPTPEPLADAPAAEPLPEPILPLATLGDCLLIGGLSIYPADRYEQSVPMPEGLELLDIGPLVGEPLLVSANGAGWITPGQATTGHWHVAADCSGGTWGFVGIAIEPPFNQTDAALNVLLAVWSWSDKHLDAMHHAGHATLAHEVVADANGPARQLLLQDDEHGRYEGAFSTGDVEPYLAEAGTIRFWMLLPEEGHHNHHDQTGPFAPVSYDLVHDGFGIVGSPDTTGFFMHSGTDHHAPLPALGGNAFGITVPLRGGVVQPGPAPSLALNTTWVH